MWRVTTLNLDICEIGYWWTIVNRLNTSEYTKFIWSICNIQHHGIRQQLGRWSSLQKTYKRISDVLYQASKEVKASQFSLYVSENVPPWKFHGWTNFTRIVLFAHWEMHFCLCVQIPLFKQTFLLIKTMLNTTRNTIFIIVTLQQI